MISAGAQKKTAASPTATEHLAEDITKSAAA